MACVVPAALQPPLQSIPQFYFPVGAGSAPEAATDFSHRLEKHYLGQPEGLPQKAFVDMAHEVSNLSDCQYSTGNLPYCGIAMPHHPFNEL